MATFLMPPGRQRAWTNGGEPAAGCKLYTYEAGTSTPKETYQDAAGTVPHENPITLDAKGEALIYWNGNYRVDLRTAAGAQVTGYPLDNFETPVMGAALADASGGDMVGYSDASTYGAGTVGKWLKDLSTESGAAKLGFQQSGTGAGLRTMQAKLRDTVNAKDFGALPGNTTVQNKAAVQAAITALNTAGGGRLVVDFDIDYGYNFRDLTTYPSFAGCTTDIVIEDYSDGTADGTNKLGAQLRMLSHTAQTSPVGQHDGNYFTISANWPPGMGVNNTANYAAAGAPGRLATDNRRAYFATYNDGVATWQIGQGNLNGAGLTDEEMSNFCIQKFHNAGDTLGDYTVMLVERKTGWISYGGGRSNPGAHHHFESPAAEPAGYDMMIESPNDTTDLVLRNSNGQPQDVILRNVAGVFGIYCNVVGDAMQVTTSNRRVWIPGSLQLRRTVAAYGPTVSVDPAAGNLFTITATNGTPFSIAQPALPLPDGMFLTYTIRNQSGGSLGTASWSSIFKMAAWTQPADGFSRSITFYCDGTNWIEVSRTPADIPN